jgi:hypothetical protein
MWRLWMIGTALAVAARAAGAEPELRPGQRLPDLRGEYLTGRQASLPDDAHGRVALLALGFTYDARFSVEAWVKRFRTDFGAAPKVTFFEIPMIGGISRLAKWFIDSGMRKGTPRDDQENVVTIYGGTGPWKERVAYGDPHAAYLILLDAEGRVAWHYGGNLAEAPYQALATQVTRLAGPGAAPRLQ